MTRCRLCGKFYQGAVCDGDHTELGTYSSEEETGERDLPAVGSWYSHRHTIGVDPNEVEVSSPCVVLAVSPAVVRLACFVAESQRVAIVDVPPSDVLPYENPLEGDR